jgi:hypothetical protein
MNIWKIFMGVLMIVAGIVSAIQVYPIVIECTQTFGQSSNFFSSIFTGSALQICYNAQLIELGGVLVALIGMIVIFYDGGYARVRWKRRK